MKKYLALGLAALLAIGATIVPDAYDKLFLRMDGTTTTFVDSSTANPKTITANGNATQLPIKFNKSAGFFNGTSDYVVVPHSTDFDFSGDFDIEFFANLSTVPTGGGSCIFLSRVKDATHGWNVQFYNNTLYFNIDAGSPFSSAWTPTKNTWYHIRVCRVSGNIKVYIDNAQLGSDTPDATDLTYTSAPVYVGGNTALTSMVHGWIKEVRISNVSRTVAVPTSEYATDANTKLLMHFDTPATSPLGPAIAFDGTGDYLDFSDSADFAPGTGAFTVEGFLNTGVPATAQTVYDTRTATANTTGFLINLASSKLCFTTATTARITGGTTLIANRTYHWRVVGNGGADGARTVTLYLNGQVEGTAYTNNYNFTDQTLRIGSIKAAAGTAFNGWMREIRVSNSERNTSSFTPSQTGYTVDANTKLYIKGNEDNGVTTFVDSSTSPKTVTTNGDTKIKYTEDYRSCIFKDETGKFPYPVGSAKVDFFAIGSGVGYFDGTGDYLSVPNHADFDITGGEWTVEFWIRPKVVSGTSAFLTLAESAGSGDRWGIYNDGADISIGIIGVNDLSTAANTIVINQWQHIAIARSGTTTTIYINGTVSTSSPTQYTVASGYDLWVGSGVSTYGDYNGLLDNIRISKGVARYTAAFNPPDDYSAPRIGKRKTNWFFFF